MVLTRNNSDEWYYPENTDEDRGILREMDNRYSEAITLNQSFWSEADIDTRFVAGDQTLWNDIYGNLPAFRRKQFNFNRMRRIRNMITGYQRKHRKSIVAVPIENNDQETADERTSVLFWVLNKAEGQEVISRAFDAGSVTTGMSLISVFLDKSRDPQSGDIKLDHVAYNGFLIDPYFKKHDLSDCNFIWRRQWLSKKQLKAIFPDREEEIEHLNCRGNRDGKFQFMAEAYNYGMYELAAYDEYWYRDLREQTVLVDTQTGESVEWRGDDKKLKEYLEIFPQVEALTTLVPTVKLAQVVEGKVFYHGKNPMGIDRYPFVVALGYYEPEIPYFPWRVQGVMRGLRDAQFLYNRRKVIELDIFESQINSGFIYKVDSLVNPKDIYLAGQGKGVALKKNAEMGDVVPIRAPDIPVTMIQLSEILAKEVQEISGVNEELLGMATDDKPGILSMLRQGAGLTTLQILFDQLDNMVKQLGLLISDIVVENFKEGKIRRILGKDPSPQFFDRSFSRFDIAIEEGLNTTTQKQLQFAQLLQLKELGMPIPASVLLDASTLQNKNQLIQAIASAEQQQMQIAQQQAMTEIEVLKAEIDALKSKGIADKGLGIERLSRVQENRALAVERSAQAEKDLQQADLNAAKTYKELQDIDITQIEKLLTILDYIKKMSSQNNEQSDIESKGENTPLAPMSVSPQGGLGALLSD